MKKVFVSILFVFVSFFFCYRNVYAFVANNLSYDHGWVDGRGNKGSLLICQATSNSVTITISKREACVVVTRVTN